MLTLYRRHLKGCSKASDRFYKRCTCPLWVEGTTNETYVRRSLKTGSWERAQALARVGVPGKFHTSLSHLRWYRICRALHVLEVVYFVRGDRVTVSDYFNIESFLMRSALQRGWRDFQTR